MTLTLELPTDLQQVLEARAQARGLSLPSYFLELATRDAQAQAQAQAEAPAKAARPLRGHGKYAGCGVSVADLLSERRAETRREMEAGA